MHHTKAKAPHSRQARHSVITPMHVDQLDIFLACRWTMYDELIPIQLISYVLLRRLESNFNGTGIALS